MALDNLAPELLSLILQAVDTPLDLYRLISASPSCLRAFSQSPQLVLLAVIQNALPGGNIKHALAVLQAPSTHDQIPPFLDKYFDSASFFDMPTNKTDLLQLYSLYNRLTYLLNRFTEQVPRRLGLLSQSSNQPCHRDVCNEGQDKASVTEAALIPSTSERVRLQRAFLRFELYCRIFPDHEDDPYGPSGPSATSHSPDQQFRLFLARLNPWEAEELCCVEQYFSTLLRQFLYDLEDDLVTAVMTTPGVVLPSSPAREPPIHEEAGEDTLIAFESLDLTDLALFSNHERYSFPDYISYMTSLGLDFMYSLVVSSRSERAALIGSNTPVTREEGFLSEALEFAPRRRSIAEDQCPTTEPEAVGEDDPFCSNLSYCLLGKTTEDTGYMGISGSGFGRLTLRHLGYIFWDAARIQSPQLLEKLVAAKNMSADEFHLAFDPRYRKTVEGRLKGIKIPQDQMKRIEREFGSTHLGE
ncbi:hypothetical protein ACJZ2D_015253 [Fusarium nematophilum]